MQNKIQSYEIIEIIGHGGTGIVYKARHKFRKEIVAIKALGHQYILELELRERFSNEAGILNRLDHPNIVKVLDFIEEPDSLNIVMEYIEGRTLDKMIGEEVGPIPYEKALILFEQILNGVSYAHQNGVIHRDLKPGNIIITKDNKVKITDFGIAKIEGGGSHTKTGTKMGTLYYMSPEQIRGERVDERSDIYSLGITLYEMLAGRLPFERKQGASDFVVMNQIVNEEIKDPREYYPYIPKELVKVIYKAISKEKERRISSVNNFINEIKSVREEIKQAIKERKPENIPEVEQKTVIAEKEETKFIKDVSTGDKENKKSILALSLTITILVIIAIVWMLLPVKIGEQSSDKTIKIGEQSSDKTVIFGEQSGYKTVKIGDQTWMAENLNVDHYRNGDPIREVQDPGRWKNLKSGAWCYYENKPENGKKYGKLYNWYAVRDPRGLALEGWHIPTKAEFATLKASVHNDGNALKAIGKGNRAGTSTNKSGFSALLAGCRSYEALFVELDNYTNFWSSTEIDTSSAYSVLLDYNDSHIYFGDPHKEFGFSVRCVKD
jgi:uncharacterized protein (TIGR02145 family)